MVTKAGGITLSEAIQIGVPTIIYKPFPGQEKENALYLEQKGFAAVAYRIDQLIEQASIILRRGEKRRGRAPAEAIRSEGRAADDIVAHIIESIETTPILHAGAGHSVHYNRRRIE
jgi:processive 1,2-diacylglycerol beta-glucosyltransferase